MATKQGRVEAKITVPSGGWSFTMSITGLVGTSARTITAGAYWPDELLAAFDAQLEAGEVALGGSSGFTSSISLGESGTGLSTVEYDGGVNFAVSAWTSTDLRDALGFTTSLSGATSYTTSVQAAGIWLPRAIMAAPRNQDDGHFEADRSVTVSPRGHVKALNYERRQRTGQIRWSHVQARYAVESKETTDGESFERWWLDTHCARVSYFGAAPLVRIYWDADVATYVEVRLIEPVSTWNTERSVPDAAIYWPVYLDGYVVPA